ncbi:hypothetical protein G6M50_06130 [Agrobacterium rhizogenes]|nr:hypothetical protein [Rhizobium rhizogenes]NTJ77380.1 hypothetical protein [Rhizobium rhizogenes]
MTVAELRKALEGLPGDILVVIGYDGGFQSSGKASQIRIVSSEEYPLFDDGPWLLIPEDD